MCISLTKNKYIARILAVALLLLMLLPLLFACLETGGGDAAFFIVQNDFKRQYFVGEAFDPTGTLMVYYDIDYYKFIPIADATVTGFDSSKKGDCDVIVTYKNLSQSVMLRIVEKSALSIELNEETLPTVLFKDHPFPTGATFTARLDDGSVLTDLPIDVSYLNGFDPASVGVQNVTVTYLGATAKFVLTVKEDGIESLSLEGLTSQNTIYEVGAKALCTDGVKLRVEYESGKYYLLDILPTMISGFDATYGDAPDENHVATITYEGHICDFSYRVIRRAERLVLDEDMPVELEKGDPFRGGGTVYYNDGTSAHIELTSEHAQAFSSEEAKTYSIEVSIGEGESAVYNYTVLPSIVSHDVTYTEVVKVGTDFNYTGGLYVVYETGESETIGFDDERITVALKRFDNAGTVEQKVSFRTIEVSMPTLVCTEDEWVAVDRIDVAGVISRVLTEGETLTDEDLSAVEVSIVYAHLDYVNVKLDPRWVTVAYPTEPLTEDYVDLAITIACYGQENTSLSVRMLSDSYVHRVTGLDVRGLKDVYAVGDVLTPAEATFVAQYGGGYSYGETTPLAEAELAGFSSAEVTENGTLTVTYKGYSKTFGYRVISRESAETVTSVEVYGFSPRLFVGDTTDDISLDGVTLTAVYGGGYDKAEGLAAERVEGGPFTQEGEAIVTVISGTCRADVAVIVYPAEDRAKVTSIRVPDMLSMQVGSTPDLESYSLIVTRGYGESVETLSLATEGVTLSVSSDGVTLPGYPSEKGQYEVKVSYGGQDYITFLSVTAGTGAKEIDIVTFVEGYKHTFAQGEEFGGVSVLIRYRDGSRSDPIPVTADMIVGFSTETTGDGQASINCYGVPLPYSYTVTTALDAGQETNEED